MGQKIRPRFSEDFLGPKVTNSPNLGVGRNFYGSGHILENFKLTDFLEKQILVTFYCCFVLFFSKNCQKVKVTYLTKNGQNYQIMLKTCFLRSLETISNGL